MGEYVVVATIGAGLGIAELVSRYRDAPERALLNLPALMYVLINAAASMGALLLTTRFDWFGYSTGGTAATTAVLVSGFGAMALFRSSLMNVRVGEHDVNVGPSALLQLVMDAVDRGVDRFRAQQRSNEVARAMADVSFERAHASLPSLCLALMQNLPDREQQILADQIEKLRDSTSLDARTKALLLGLYLMNVVGPHVLLASVRILAGDIRRVRSITLPQSLHVEPGGSCDAGVSVQDAQAGELDRDAVRWLSSDPTVATVSDRGLVTGVAPGKAAIVASMDGVTATAVVVVGERRAADQIRVERTDAADTDEPTPDQPVP